MTKTKIAARASHAIVTAALPSWLPMPSTINSRPTATSPTIGVWIMCITSHHCGPK
jgi:hypothetical protein